MAFPAAALIGAGSSLLGGYFGNRSLKREAEKQRQFSESMWNKQNAYNTPKMQMERLKAAGLNPALMYGQGNVGNAEKALPYQQPQIENIGAAAAQSAAAGAQLSLVNAQKQNIEADTQLKLGNVELTSAQASSELAKKLNIDAQKANTIQQTLNLETTGQIMKFESAIKAIESDRATNKGIVKGDTIGNMLSILNLDPANNPKDRQLLQAAITAYFGAKIAKDILSGIGMAKGKTFQTTIGKQVKNYGKD